MDLKASRAASASRSISFALPTRGVMLHSKGSGSIYGMMVKISAKDRFVGPHAQFSGGVCLGVNNYTFLHFDIKGIAKMRQNQKQWIHGKMPSRAYPDATEGWIHVGLYESNDRLTA